MTRRNFPHQLFLMPVNRSIQLSILVVAFSCTGLTALAQIALSGRVSDEKGRPIGGASVSIENSLDGCLSDSLGRFSITALEKGAVTILVSAVGFTPLSVHMLLIGDSAALEFTLTQLYKKLTDVVITAGSFAVADNSKTILKPMDIMTTAGANSDVVKAMQTLPGTQQSGAATGLFVRGGDAAESMVIIDEMTVQNAFFSNIPGVSQSSRFGPFQFKGISFSSGGYGVRYGQALSSVLELNTQDLPEKNRISMGANLTGAFASGLRLWKRSALEFSAFVNNSSLFYELAKSNIPYVDKPGGNGASLRYLIQTGKDALLKMAIRYTKYTAGLVTPDPFSPGDSTHFYIDNYNTYSSISWQKQWRKKAEVYISASYSSNRDNIKWVDTAWGVIPYVNNDHRTQFRAEGRYHAESNLSLLYGIEGQSYGYDRLFDTVSGKFREVLAAGYLEANWTLFRILALRPGIRYEHSQLLQQAVLQPRLSFAVKTGEFSQISVAEGVYFQDPENLYLLNGFRPAMQEATHTIANFQWIRSERTFRFEMYYKNYLHLTRENTNYYDPNPYREIQPNSEVDNTGHGYAKGAELFWRDKKLFKNFDYWVSYSFIDSKRIFQNYLKEVMPDFVSTHNMTLVAKYFSDPLQTSFSITESFASGRPYFNPSNSAFFADRTPPFENLALSIGHLTSIRKCFTVIYLGIDNVTNNHNIFGYRYSSDATLKYPILPALYRSVIVGFSISLSQFDKSEL
jgi:hypothetical protein